MQYGGRGYTGHEQLNQFGLINMNARLPEHVVILNRIEGQVYFVTDTVLD